MDWDCWSSFEELVPWWKPLVLRFFHWHLQWHQVHLHFCYGLWFSRCWWTWFEECHQEREVVQSRHWDNNPDNLQWKFFPWIHSLGKMDFLVPERICRMVVHYWNIWSVQRNVHQIIRLDSLSEWDSNAFLSNSSASACCHSSWGLMDPILEILSNCPGSLNFWNIHFIMVDNKIWTNQIFLWSSNKKGLNFARKKLEWNGSCPSDVYRISLYFYNC